MTESNNFQNEDRFHSLTPVEHRLSELIDVLAPLAGQVKRQQVSLASSDPMLSAAIADLTQRITQLEHQLSSQSDNSPRESNLAVPSSVQRQGFAYPPLIPVTLMSALLGAVITYSLIQFFPSQDGILSRINSRVNDIQITLQKNVH